MRREPLLLAALLVVLAAAPRLLVHGCPLAYTPLQPPSPGHPLGTDPLGRDAACVLAEGIPSSIEAAAAALASSLLVLAAAMAAGVSPAASRAVDAAAALAAGLPRMSLLMTLALAATLSPPWIGVLVGLLASLQGARAVASRSRQVAAAPYAEAARAIGASRARILLRHIAPNVADALASYASMAAAAAVYAEAGLSMLGLEDPSTPSPGKLANLVLQTPGALLTAAGTAQLTASLAAVAVIAYLAYRLLRAAMGPTLEA